MFVHHLATIGLITFSYINNMVRVGTLVMCLHDASDFLLEVRPQPPFPHYSSFFTFPPKNWLSPQLNSYLPFSRQPSWPIMPSISVSVTPFL